MTTDAWLATLPHVAVSSLRTSTCSWPFPLIPSFAALMTRGNGN